MQAYTYGSFTRNLIIIREHLLTGSRTGSRERVIGHFGLDKVAY